MRPPSRLFITNSRTIISPVFTWISSRASLYSVHLINLIQAAVGRVLAALSWKMKSSTKKIGRTAWCERRFARRQQTPISAMSLRMAPGLPTCDTASTPLLCGSSRSKTWRKRATAHIWNHSLRPVFIRRSPETLKPEPSRRPEGQMYLVHVHVRVKPESVQAFKQATLINSRESNKEPGIFRFDFLQQQDDPTCFLLVEGYRSDEASA